MVNIKGRTWIRRQIELWVFRKLCSGNHWKIYAGTSEKRGQDWRHNICESSSLYMKMKMTKGVAIGNTASKRWWREKNLRRNQDRNWWRWKTRIKYRESHAKEEFLEEMKTCHEMLPGHQPRQKVWKDMTGFSNN